MRNYLFLKPSKKISFYSPKLIVSLSYPSLFFLHSKEQAKIAEDIKDFFGCLKYLSAYHKNADDFFKSEQCHGILLCYGRTVFLMFLL